MVAKTTPEVEHQILGFLEIPWSYSVIIKHFAKKGIKIASGTITNIKKRNQNKVEKVKKVETRGRKSVLSEVDLQRLKRMTENPNPTTQQEMANKLKTTRDVVKYQTKKVLGKKLVKKPKGQVLSDQTIEKRRKRSWGLYRRLRGERWTKVITSDEALFHLTDQNRKTRVQYLSRDQKRSQLETFTKVSHPKGVMVWIGISAKGCTQVRFVKPGAKINSDYYIEKILKPFIRKDIPKLYPNRDFLFHQDSAPSHVSKKTLKFLRDNNIPFITPSEWMPNSPDCAPLDYFFWGYLKNRVNQRKFRTISGLKKVIVEEVKKIPQSIINKALKSWSRRRRQIYYNKGLHIEKHN